jgi:transporter family-2 protein
MIPLKYALLAIGMGACISIYLPMLSQSARIAGSPVLVNVVFYVIAAATSAIIFLVIGQSGQISNLGAVPPWMHLAGVVSAFMIIGSVFLIPRIGAGPFFVLLVAGQILAGAIVSHLGMLGSPQDPATVKKATGIALAIGGAYLVTMK